METFECRNPALWLLLFFFHTAAETFKLPQSWQLLADHHWPVLKSSPVAKCSVVSVACSQATSVWQTWLSHWPEPLHLLPAQPLMSSSLRHTHMHSHKHTHGTSLLFHSPLTTTFRCLHFSYCSKKQYQTSCSPQRVHTHVHTHINTGPKSRLMLIWHHQWGV